MFFFDLFKKGHKTSHTNGSLKNEGLFLHTVTDEGNFFLLLFRHGDHGENNRRYN